MAVEAAGVGVGMEVVAKAAWVEDGAECQRVAVAKAVDEVGWAAGAARGSEAEMTAMAAMEAGEVARTAVAEAATAAAQPWQSERPRPPTRGGRGGPGGCERSLPILCRVGQPRALYLSV